MKAALSKCQMSGCWMGVGCHSGCLIIKVSGWSSVKMLLVKYLGLKKTSGFQESICAMYRCVINLASSLFV